MCALPLGLAGQRLGGRLVFDFPAVREARLRKYLVVPVDLQLAFIEGRLEKVQQVARVHLARVIGEIAGQIERTDDLHALVLDDFARARELTVTALLGGDVDHDRAGPHALYRGARDDLWRRPTRHGCGRPDGVRRRDPRVEHFLLLTLFFVGELASVPTRAVGTDPGVDELRAQGLHLFLGCAAHVIRFDYRSEAPRGRDGLESRDSRPNDENLRRADSPGGGGEHRHELLQIVGGDEHSLVAGDGRLRRQGVHRLCSRDTRNEFHGETGDPALLQRFDLRLPRVGLHETDDHGPRLKPLNLVHGERLDGQDHIRLLQHGARRVRPGDVLICGIRELRPGAGTTLDQNPGSGLGELPGDLWNHTY